MKGEIMTVVEGNVEQVKWEKLLDGYKNIKESVPKGVIFSFITQERNDPNLWRLITIWENLELLKEMQQNHSVPPGVKIFKDIGVDPKVKVFTVRDNISIN